jgi:Integrase core domain
MYKTIGKEARTELLGALRERYERAPKAEKSRVLDEFVAVAGCHRKHAIRLLTGSGRAGLAAPGVDRRTYDEAVREAVIMLWEAADRICGKRLKAILPSLVTSLERHGHLGLEPTVRQRVLAASPATLDRLLASVRSTACQRKKRKTATKPSKQVPIRTFADWNEPPPGYLEIDFVAHGGSSMQGTFLWSLVATDVCSGWTEGVPLVAREQALVAEGLEVIRRQFPVPVLGIDSDNDSAFINDTLLGYCQQQGLEFTRSRAYRKNDQAWIEQKNGAVVRRFVGYDRLTGLVALELLQRIREGQAALAALGSGDLGSGPGRESLEQFLAKLPELWREGEARPTHRQGASEPRSWRTRKDPFDGVWTEILAWLQGNPEATAKSLLARLHRSTRDGSRTASCGPCSAASESGGGWWRGSWSTPAWTATETVTSRLSSVPMQKARGGVQRSAAGAVTAPSAAPSVGQQIIIIRLL